MKNAVAIHRIAIAVFSDAVPRHIDVVGVVCVNEGHQIGRNTIANGLTAAVVGLEEDAFCQVSGTARIGIDSGVLRILDVEAHVERLAIGLGRPTERHMAKRHVDRDGLDARAGRRDLCNVIARSIIDMDHTTTETVHSGLGDIHRPTASGTEANVRLIGNLTMGVLANGIHHVIESIETRDAVIDEGHRGTRSDIVLGVNDFVATANHDLVDNRKVSVVQSLGRIDP